MRPNRLYVPYSEGRSFDLRHEQVPFFANPWHFHPELELNYVVSSIGTRFIGRTVERFEPGDIVLLGKNLPHYWKNDAIYQQPDSPGPAEAIVVRFADDFVGQPFLNLPEIDPLKRLMTEAGSGLRLLEPLRTHVATQLRTLLSLRGFSQLLTLLDILHQIAQSGARTVVSPHYVPTQAVLKQGERLSRVMAHLMEHFTEPVALPVMAEMASMNPAAFCRYFKQQTGQTLSQFITDLRIRHACDLLLKTNDTVTTISEAAGFENVSYFVQLFRQQRGQTPMAFRQQAR